ncbi:hypothetical protein ACE6H2_009876 [Prunus campanulata]
MDAAATTPNKSNSLLGNDFAPNGLNPPDTHPRATEIQETHKIRLVRIDFAPNGLNPPHTHPRATEILVVLEGKLYVGFVTSNGDGNRLFTKVLNKGDVFVFPIGLIRFQLNVGHVNAVAFARLSSLNPGVITTANAVFGSKPPINPDVLTKAFQVDNKDQTGIRRICRTRAESGDLAGGGSVMGRHELKWCHDIGREHASNKPLLNTVFQVMMRLFGPRKTTLIFVIRDKTKTPLENLESELRNDIQKIWESAPKPEAHKETPLSEFFNVEVVALTNYEDKEDTFKEEVACMRQKFFHHNKLAGDRQAVVPASGFSLSLQEIWEKIKKDRDLDIPSIKVMVATVRCEEIANEKYSAFAANEEWIQLKVISVHPGGFGKKLSSMIDTFISEYDEEATYYDEGVKSVKRKQLEEKLLQLVQPAFQDQLELKRSSTLDKFKEAFDKALDGVIKGFSVTARNFTESFMAQFDEGCADAVIKQANWDTSKVRDKLRRDIGAHVASVHADKIKDHCEAKLRELLSGPVEALLKQANNMTWPTIRRRLREAHESAFSGSAAAISGFDMDEQTKAKIDASLEKYVRRMVDAKAKEEAGRVLIHMKER